MTVAAGCARWRPAYIGLGSNLNAPRDQLMAAVEALAKVRGTRLESLSPFYRSAPMGPPDQPDYVNAVAALLTRLSAHELLAELQSIERAQGRVRGAERWGPRPLDLDLLVFGADKIDAADLSVPHPGIADRNFVLLPLRDIAPDLEVPGKGSVRALVREVDADPSSIARLED